MAATIDSAGADVLIQRYREDLDAGRLREAERNLDTALARYPDQFDAERQRSLQQGLAQARAEVERGVQQEAEAREAREAAEERNRELRPLQQRLDRGQKSYERALAESKNSSTANRHLDSAIRDLRHVVEGADRLLADDQSDQVLAKQASRLRETATSRLVDALLTSASLYTVRGQFNPAIGRVNEALLLDEGNARALAMRGRIEVAANEQQWGWGW